MNKAIVGGKPKGWEAPAGADRRYRYVPFASLARADRLAVDQRYVNCVAHLPDDEYMYPIKKDGRIANARRWISGERAAELYAEWVAREVHES